MRTVADLVAAGRGSIRLLGGVGSRGVRTVRSVEHLGDLDGVEPDALVVVASSAVVAAHSYEFDLAVRRAAAAELAGLVLPGCGELPFTAVRLADRVDVALLGCDDRDDIATTIVRLDQLLRGDAATDLARATSVVDVVRRLEALDGTDVPELLDAAGAALGTALRLAGPDEVGEPVLIDGRCTSRVHAGADDTATALALPVLAAAVSRLIGAANARRALPQRARAAILAELVTGDASATAAVLQRARALDVAVDGVHAVICLAGAAATESSESAVLAAQSRRDWAATVAVEALASSSDTWTVTAVEDDVLAVCTRRGARANDWHHLHPAAELILRQLHAERPDTAVFAGIGSAHPGPAGLRTTAAEARAAAAGARAAGRPHTAAAFDATGVRRVLAEIRASTLSRNVLDALLAPLDKLGPERANTAIETLGALLDAQGSPQAAAARLHLHPNAVRYRIRRIRQHLDVDLDDPDARFALLLACRVRLIRG
ncbi:MAG TPA: helix-turn-helix domain-containing protein [Pseudonocardia sp.]|jgi:sugar diacid utilization regulator|nr:helix-turn-helix domain-containing protein [Pseudonocardia sp.]